MWLEQLKTNFGDMLPIEQQEFFEEYLVKRTEDLEKTAIIKTKKVNKGKKMTISADALDLLKGLGLVN